MVLNDQFDDELDRLSRELAAARALVEAARVVARECRCYPGDHDSDCRTLRRTLKAYDAVIKGAK